MCGLFSHSLHHVQTEEAVFQCPGLFQIQSWNHVAIVMNKDSVLRDKVLRGKPKVTLYVNGKLVGTHKVRIHGMSFVCNLYI